MATKLEQAGASFVATLHRLGVDQDGYGERDWDALGRRAALLVSAEAFWERLVGPYYSTGQVQELLGVTRQAVSDLARRGRLLALPVGRGRVRFPAFQFEDGQPTAVMPAVLVWFREAEVDPYAVAAWWQTEQALLDGQSPREWLRAGGEPALVVEAARRTVARLGQ